jgi:hypothetical protein
MPTPPEAAPPADAPCQTPRGGSNRRPGRVESSGAPPHARESENLRPLSDFAHVHPLIAAEVERRRAGRWVWVVEGDAS